MTEAQDKKDKKDKIAQMRAQTFHDAKAPYPKSEQELYDYIGELLGQQHDYNTTIYAASLATVATFHFMMLKLGGTGFQASCADLDFLRRVRNLSGPFTLVQFEKALYPQYDVLKEVQTFLDDCRPWLAEQAKIKLQTHMPPDERANHPNVDFPYVAPVVWEHWRKLAEFKE